MGRKKSDVQWGPPINFQNEGRLTMLHTARTERLISREFQDAISARRNEMLGQNDTAQLLDEKAELTKEIASLKKGVTKAQESVEEAHRLLKEEDFIPADLLDSLQRSLDGDANVQSELNGRFQKLQDHSDGLAGALEAQKTQNDTDRTTWSGERQVIQDQLSRYRTRMNEQLLTYKNKFTAQQSVLDKEIQELKSAKATSEIELHEARRSISSCVIKTNELEADARAAQQAHVAEVETLTSSLSTLRLDLQHGNDNVTSLNISLNDEKLRFERVQSDLTTAYDTIEGLEGRLKVEQHKAAELEAELLIEQAKVLSFDSIIGSKKQTIDALENSLIAERENAPVQQKLAVLAALASQSSEHNGQINALSLAHQKVLQTQQEKLDLKTRDVEIATTDLERCLELITGLEENLVACRKSNKETCESYKELIGLYVGRLDLYWEEAKLLAELADAPPPPKRH
ncbi:hypothetical protein EG328_005905 [Venturia inaequalis]|uniref:Uncharacterized protein n=1 Tax=Venturia inaequalis TaxID=5025 RepID=A0A8H3UKN4_VENIN|nr:hypothetical protein EG328_005905 [Venturia inaequalis]RDI88896.1 hypothetical protein Vi05172_g1040 [Venturia inaequalis]